MSERMVPCGRCGVTVRRHARANALPPSKRTAPICHDCRAADPVYVRAVRRGQRAA